MNVLEKETERGEEETEEKLPSSVCSECRQKKQFFIGSEGKICSDCYKKKSRELRPLSPDFMNEEELGIWNNLSEEERQKHSERVTKEKEGGCYQCGDKQVKTIEFLERRYCSDCWKWQTEGMKSGINSIHRYSQQRCRCRPCRLRRSLSSYSTRELMIEILERKDFDDVTTWEDDGFLQRFEEIIVELKETENFEHRRITEVNQDICRKASKRKKYSRGV